MKKIMHLLFIVTSIFCSACDPLLSFEYEINNQTSSKLKVESKEVSINKADILPDSKSIIYISGTLGQGSGRLYNVEKFDTLSYLEYKVVVKNEKGQPLNFNFKETKRWEYQATEKYRAKYTITLTDKDF